MPKSDGPAHFHLFLLRNFLDPDHCARLTAELDSAPTTRAPVYLEGVEGTIHETVRKTASLHPARNTVRKIKRRLSSQKSALDEHFGTSLKDCERPQFLRYETGDFFVRHQDGNTDQLDFDHLRARRVSIVVFLNDSFAGGSLTFYDRRKKYGLAGETGLLVAFKADTVHEVLPVTSGKRFTIISWFR
jgi:SM-20-related protein